MIPAPHAERQKAAKAAKAAREKDKAKKAAKKERERQKELEAREKQKQNELKKADTVRRQREARDRADKRYEQMVHNEQKLQQELEEILQTGKRSAHANVARNKAAGTIAKAMGEPGKALIHLNKLEHIHKYSKQYSAALKRARNTNSAATWESVPVQSAGKHQTTVEDFAAYLEIISTELGLDKRRGARLYT